MSWIERARSVKAVLKQVKELGYEKERAAAALLSLSFFGILYFLVGLNAPPGWGRAFAGLAGCYLVAFFALAAQWFWARWFASGLGWSGFMVGIASLVMVGWHPTLVVYTFFHGVIVATLMGKKMAARYEQQTAWRERYSMDEFGVTRLGKAVTRGSASLPTLILWALAPRDQGMALAWLPVAGLFVTGLALTGMLRLRTWGVLALLGTAGVLLYAGSGGSSGLALAASEADLPSAGLWALLAAPTTALAWTAAAFAPLARPMWRALRG